MNAKKRGIFMGIATALMIMVFMAMPAILAQAEDTYYTAVQVDAIVAGLQAQIDALAPPPNVYRVSPYFTLNHEMRTYPTIQGAVDDAKENPTSLVEIDIYPGIYAEDVQILNDLDNAILLQFSPGALLTGLATSQYPALTISNAFVQIDNLWTQLAAEYNKDPYIDFNGSEGMMLITNSYFGQGSFLGQGNKVSVRIEGSGYSVAYIMNTIFDITNDTVGVEVNGFDGIDWGISASTFKSNGHYQVTAVKLIDTSPLLDLSHIQECTFSPYAQIYIDQHSVLGDLLQNYLDDSQVIVEPGGAIINWSDRAPHNLLPYNVYQVSPGFTVDPIMHHYPRIQDAVDAIMSGPIGTFEIMVNPGTYTEDVIIDGDTLHKIDLQFTPFSLLAGSNDANTPALTIKTAWVTIDGLATFPFDPFSGSVNKNTYINFDPPGDNGWMSINNSYFFGAPIRISSKETTALGVFAYILNSSFDIVDVDKPAILVDNFHGWEWGISTSEFRPLTDFQRMHNAIRVINSPFRGSVIECTFNPSATISLIGTEENPTHIRQLTQNYLHESQVIIGEHSTIDNWLDRAPHIPPYVYGINCVAVPDTINSATGGDIYITCTTTRDGVGFQGSDITFSAITGPGYERPVGTWDYNNESCTGTPPVCSVQAGAHGQVTVRLTVAPGELTGVDHYLSMGGSYISPSGAMATTYTVIIY